MAIDATSAIFVDTNILIYASSQFALKHVAAKTELERLRKLGCRLWISRQVIREYCSVTTRSDYAPQPISSADAARQAALLSSRFYVANDDARSGTALLTLIEKLSIRGLRVHDANIVATMLANNVTHLLTNDLADFKIYSGFIELLKLG